MKFEFNENDVVRCETLETFCYSLGSAVDVPPKFVTAPVTDALINEMRWKLPCKCGLVRGSKRADVYLTYCLAGKLYVYQLRKEERNGKQEIS